MDNELKPNTFITDFLDYAALEPGPIVWHKFAALGMVSALMERRMHLGGAVGETSCVTWPNLFIFIVGRAGSGKSRIVSKIEEMIKEHNNKMVSEHKIILSSDKMNGATFIEELMNSYHPTRKQSALWLLQDEMGVSFQDFGAVTFTTDLLKFFDCPSEFSKRIRDKHEVVTNSCINILAGTTKTFLQRFLPSESRAEGLVSRGIFVHVPEIEKVDRFRRSRNTTDNFALYNKIVNSNIPRLLNLSGDMKETKEAFAYADELSGKYYDEQRKQPEGSVLDNYFARKSMQVLKVGMCLAASEYSKIVEKRHYEIADEWLTELEPNMNSIFASTDMRWNKQAGADFALAIPFGQEYACTPGELIGRLKALPGMYPDDPTEITNRIALLVDSGEAECERNGNGEIIKVWRVK